MRIYTRTGDDGTSGLIGGRRVQKSDLRLEAFGSVDELNACIGVAICSCPEELSIMLQPVQHELFVIGAQLASPDPSTQAPSVRGEMIQRLEGQIDALEAMLPALRQFIVPGGSESAARLHLARCVCRRAERCVVALAEQTPVDAQVLAYLNRLSDWLFVLARRANQMAGLTDVPWAKP